MKMYPDWKVTISTLSSEWKLPKFTVRYTNLFFFSLRFRRIEESWNRTSHHRERGRVKCGSIGNV